MGTASSTPSRAEFDREDCPPELDPYWPSRIAHDRLWYSQYVTRDSRFYDPHEDHVFRIDDFEHGHDVFTLEPCAKTADLGEQFTAPTESEHWVDNVCDLAGSLEAGDLVHLDSGVVRSVGENTFLSVGEVTIEIPGSLPEADPLLEQLDPPNGPAASDITKLAPVLEDHDTEPVLYAPRNVATENPAANTQYQDQLSNTGQPTSRTGENVETEFFSVQPFSRWTFEDETIRRWVESHFEPGDKILNACAGETKLTAPPNGRIVRNDVNEERDADYHRDVATLAAVPEFDPSEFDLIIFDPPWSVYQSNLRYEGNLVTKDGVPEIDLTTLPFDTPGPDEKTQLGHSRLAKEGFDYLLKPGGMFVELTFHGTAMPNRLGYEQVRRAIFNPLGEAKAVIGSVDQKVRRELSDFY